MVRLRLKRVLRMGAGPPTVVTADASLTVIDVDGDEVLPRQLIGMFRLLEIFRRVASRT